MPDEKLRKERISIYLAKDSYKQDDQLLVVENAKEPITLASFEAAKLYIKKEPVKDSPVWTKLLRSDANVPIDAFGKTSSVGAVAIVNYLGRRFILTFGTGYHLIKDDAIERDFGLRVTLNSVTPDKLRSLDKASYDHNNLNSRVQSPRNVDIFDLSIDSDLDIVYAVTGMSSVPVFGETVTGRDALTLNVETDLVGILEILSEAKKRYESKLPSQFEWIDNVVRVKDKDTIQILDLELDDLLATPENAALWLGEPEIVDWETQIGYSFDLYPKSPRHVVLQLDDLANYLSKKGQTLTTEALKGQPIHINNQNFEVVHTWSAYRCLYAELTMGQERFILRNANWFKVDAKFATEITTELSALPTYSVALPNYARDREEDYNEFVAAGNPSFHLMDKKTIQIGGKYDKLEFCDLLRNGNELIHVKYYRSSGTLSHLFAQGNVAAEAFIKDVEFRNRVNEKLPLNHKLVDVVNRPDPKKYQVVYAIATTKEIPAELPFFSQVTLKNATRTLRALDFPVALCRIAVDPALVKKEEIQAKRIMNVIR